MEIVEEFISINGEGEDSGKIAYFVRFKGCNLNCNYCDTKWANRENCKSYKKSPEEITEGVYLSGIERVTLTGGEPLLQDGIKDLVYLLGNSKKIKRIEIETNGSIDIAPFCNSIRPIFTIDYKLPCSGFENAMINTNYRYLSSEDTVKFVVGSMDDLFRAKEIIEHYDLCSKCHVHLSPVFGAIEPERIVEFMVRNRLNSVRLQLQVHKIIWGADKRGV